MRFGFVTDELSQDPREAIETALAWGVRDFELRSVRDVRFPRHRDDTLELLARLCEEHEVQYTAVSPGFFKCGLGDRAHIDYALGEGLDRAMEFMAQCQVPLLICFGFDRDSGPEDQAVELLQRLAERLDENGFRGAVENHADSFFDVPDRIGALLRRVNRLNLGANWDIANLKQHAPEGYPEGYETVKQFVFNVHAKDVAILPDGSTEWRPIGEGVCDWPRQMAALKRDGTVDHITIESHCGPAVEVGHRNLRVLQGYFESATASKA